MFCSQAKVSDEVSFVENPNEAHRTDKRGCVSWSLLCCNIAQFLPVLRRGQPSNIDFYGYGCQSILKFFNKTAAMYKVWLERSQTLIEISRWVVVVKDIPIFATELHSGSKELTSHGETWICSVYTTNISECSGFRDKYCTIGQNLAIIWL